MRPIFNRVAGTYTKIDSINGLSNNKILAPLQTGMWWKNLFLKNECTKEA